MVEHARAAVSADAPAAESEPVLQFDPMLPAWMLAALAAAWLLLILRVYFAMDGQSVPRRIALAGMRLGALGLILLCLCHPVFTRQTRAEEKGKAFIALDCSSSMGFRDSAAGRTRWETARDVLKANAARIEALGTRLELQRYLFSDLPRGVASLPGESPGAPAEPAGLSTNLAAVLERIGADAAGIPTAGVLLFSDGRHTAAQSVLERAQALGREGVPVFAVGLGEEALPAAYTDIRIAHLDIPEKTFAGARIAFRVETESSLPEAREAKLRVEVDGKSIHERSVKFTSGTGRSQQIEIPYTPESAGVHRVTAVLETVPGEANLGNNRQTGYFRSFRGKLGVWYAEGALRKEFGAIRSALQTAQNLNLTAVNAFQVQTSSAADLLPASDAEWGQTRLVIIGDLPAERFERAGLSKLAARVDEGCAVLMIGGVSNFGKGGWQTSPLAPVLPVEMSGTDLLLAGPLPVRVQEDEADSPVLRLHADADKNLEIWAKLPNVPGVNTFSSVRPLAHVLLRAGTRELLVTQDYGKGRSAVLATDATWQWQLKAGQGEALRTFWRNLAVWLIRSDYRDNDKALFAETDRLRCQPGDEVVLSAHVHESGKWAEAVKNARVTYAFEHGGVPVRVENVGRGAGDYTRRWVAGEAGSYRFTASLHAPDGKVLDRDSVDFESAAPDLENDNPQANLKLLRRVAEASGGAYFTPAEAAKALARMDFRQVSFFKSFTETTELWCSPWMWAGLVVLLALEWLLRKRWGLV